MIDMTMALATILVTQATTPATAPQADPPRAASPEGYEPPVPIGDQGDWFPVDAYPPEARRAGDQGRVSIKLMLDPLGKPSACVITESSGSAALDAKTCELAMHNGRFRPARQKGRAIASTYQLRGVRWQLDSDPGNVEVNAAGTVLTDTMIEVSIDTTGQVTACKVLTNYQRASDPCVGAAQNATSLPRIMNGGRRIAGKALIGFSITLLPDKTASK
ncbi:energy transducer TonB [Sphingomonas sp. MA1305]|uniref:energy transducer TonB n=1 Tax=Sphingomonas sp. MA1305 TaxID=2479204 RepID=UPI0018DF4CFE|nr:energy transducer TonB [Sphingomonas sp. MA1305]MBI0475105.1 energy transducer TonB [Sphingomonas sp. MA1305]